MRARNSRNFLSFSTLWIKSINNISHTALSSPSRLLFSLSWHASTQFLYHPFLWVPSVPSLTPFFAHLAICVKSIESLWTDDFDWRTKKKKKLPNDFVANSSFFSTRKKTKIIKQWWQQNRQVKTLFSSEFPLTLTFKWGWSGSSPLCWLWCYFITWKG